MSVKLVKNNIDLMLVLSYCIHAKKASPSGSVDQVERFLFHRRRKLPISFFSFFSFFRREMSLVEGTSTSRKEGGDEDMKEIEETSPQSPSCPLPSAVAFTRKKLYPQIS
jgi:hypothetical protein